MSKILNADQDNSRIASGGSKRYKANDGSILFNPIEREVKDIIEKMDKEEDEQMEADK